MKGTEIINRVVKVNFQGVPWMMLFSMLLVVLKCLGKFPYSWWWATAPLWGPSAVVLGVIAAVVAVVLVGAALAFLGYIALEGLQAVNRAYRRRKDRKRREKERQEREAIIKALQGGVQ